MLNSRRRHVLHGQVTQGLCLRAGLSQGFRFRQGAEAPKSPDVPGTQTQAVFTVSLREWTKMRTSQERNNRLHLGAPDIPGRSGLILSGVLH